MSRKRTKKSKPVDQEERAEKLGSHAATEPAPEQASAEPPDASERDRGDGGDETSERDALRADNERLAAEALELRELAQRKQAEFENYRRRTERERADILRHAAADLVGEILPVLDNLGRAVESSERGSEEQLREGVAIIYKQFKDILERSGLEEIECEGQPFDPHVHEAVSRIETDEHPDGTVVEVFQKGYRLKDRLLRPSMVSVSQSNREPEASDSDADADADADSDSDSEPENEDEVVRHSD